MEKTILFSEEKYSLWRQEGIPAEAIDFLKSVSWGNEGAIYEHKNTAKHIQHLHKPSLISIREGEKLQGTAVFCNSHVWAGNAFYNCYYIRYFSAAPQIRGKGLMKAFGKKVMEAIREGEKEKTIFFACVESGNKVSYRVVESAGYQNIGTVKTLGFSRFFPRKSNHIKRIKTELDRQEVLALLRKQYKHHALVQFNSIFMHDNYFVIRENGEIVAGCQLHRVHWRVNAMPGFSGKIIMKLVPKIPLLNKIFNPARFEFLAFEGIYYKPGHERRLHELMEGLLAQEKLNTGMFWLGEKSNFYHELTSYGKLGLIHAFVKDSDIYMLANFQNMTEAEAASVKESSIYLSAFDCI